MALFRYLLRPHSGFATPLRGDTLFGHLAWAVRHRFGEAKLVDLLQGYCDGKPFAVLSDPSPQGFVPRPKLPRARLAQAPDSEARKEDRKRQWARLDKMARLPLEQWQFERIDWQAGSLRAHNSLNRRSWTTDGDFAPFQTRVVHYAMAGQPARLDVYAVLDEARLSATDFSACLADIGAVGYGAEAPTGAGRFEVAGSEAVTFTAPEGANAWLALAPCAVQGLDWNAKRSWYAPLVRFGRHGDVAALSGSPWKNPVVLADCGAVLTPTAFRTAAYVGRGLTGVSRTAGLEGTVHQGYAPVLPVAVTGPS